MAYPHQCCNTPGNLERQELAPDRWVSVCRVCNRKHYGMRVDPGFIGLRGAALGRKVEPQPVPIGYTDTLGGKA